MKGGERSEERAGTNWEEEEDEDEDEDEEDEEKGKEEECHPPPPPLFFFGVQRLLPPGACLASPCLLFLFRSHAGSSSSSARL